jgi:hypothetical protein
MASHSRRLAQNHVAAPLRWEGIESDYGPSGQECYRGGPAHNISEICVRKVRKKLDKTLDVRKNPL